MKHFPGSFTCDPPKDSHGPVLVENLDEMLALVFAETDTGCKAEDLTPCAHTGASTREDFFARSGYISYTSYTGQREEHETKMISHNVVTNYVPILAYV